MPTHKTSRRDFLSITSLLGASLAAPKFLLGGLVDSPAARTPLTEFDYADVTLASPLHNQQLDANISVLMELSEDSLLKPLRKMAGLPASGEELGGWYLYDPAFDGRSLGPGFAPACTFGQWVSALARAYAITRDEKIRNKVLRLNRAYAKTISAAFYENNRFPAYCYDKFVCGLMDSHRLANDPDALRILDHTTDVALPCLPGKAIEHGIPWRPGKDDTYTMDESYTIAENLFLAYQRGAGDRYRTLGEQYLDDEYFNPLADGQSNFAGRHAYSHVNSLCSAMQAYITLGSEKHLRAAKNGFDFLAAQSFATGGWGPDETLLAPDSDGLYESLTKSHNSFETPCGSYAHFKLTRYLLQATPSLRYGDSMERVMYNTVLGAKPLQTDGSTFYYADYNFKANKVYSDRHWACCSGTLPQVAADYGINTYFRDSNGIYVNLYIPSTLRWTQGGARYSLTQKTEYPFDSHIQFEVKASSPKEFTIGFRTPAWTEGATIYINGRRPTMASKPGQFGAVRKEWKNGDRIDLELPLKTRLEPINPQHPDTVALLCGPQVLFAIDNHSPTVTRKQLIAATQTGPQTWHAETATGPLTFRPFTAITNEQYSTYVSATDEG